MKFLFNLGDALDDVKYSYGFKDVAVAGLKLLGKSAVNTVQGVGKVAVDVAKGFPEAMAKDAKKSSREILDNPNLTDEKRKKAEDLNKKANDWIEANEKTKKMKEKERKNNELKEEERKRKQQWLKECTASTKKDE